MQDENPNHRVLQTGHYAGLKFEEGWFFIHVLETEFTELKPWILLNENGNRDVIAADTAGSTDDEIVDEVERHLVTPRDNEQNLVFQLLVGVSPSRMRVYPLFGRDRAPNLTGGAEPGSPQLAFDGYDSPYNNPSTQAEFFNVNGIDQLQLQAFNPMNEPSEARLSFHVNKMKYAVIDDIGVMADFIQGRKTFRDHSMGLGAQSTDQVRAPGWLMDKFGDAVMTTKEILEEAESSGQNGSASIGDRLPETSMGG
jgi:hypothetical protein